MRSIEEDLWHVLDTSSLASRRGGAEGRDKGGDDEPLFGQGAEVVVQLRRGGLWEPGRVEQAVRVGGGAAGGLRWAYDVSVGLAPSDGTGGDGSGESDGDLCEVSCYERLERVPASCVEPRGAAAAHLALVRQAREAKEATAAEGVEGATLPFSVRSQAPEWVAEEHRKVGSLTGTLNCRFG